jgi:1,4-alpha-glucan branching enzyme
MSVSKRYLRTKPVGKVTFRLPKEAVKSAKQVFLVGEFNGWNATATPMKKLKNGDFTVTVDLEAGREYQYRYLIDGLIWENDWKADKYAPSPYAQVDNSVVIV